jgi:hypothetical protein
MHNIDIVLHTGPMPMKKDIVHIGRASKQNVRPRFGLMPVGVYTVHTYLTRNSRDTLFFLSTGELQTTFMVAVRFLIHKKK